MAEKHKSKYKTPKDLEKSQKPKTRKDLKDYTFDNKDSLNPYATGKKQDLVARKDDKAVVDDSNNLTIKMKDNDRLYKDLENGDYDPKHAHKILKKRQEDDSDEYLEKLDLIDRGVTTTKLKERINKLSKEQRDNLVREYLRRKISKILYEQPTAEEEPTEPAPTDTTAPDAAAPAPTPTDTTAPDAAAPAADTTTPAPTDAATPAPDATTPAPAETPAPAANTEVSPETQEAIDLDRFVKYLGKQEGNLAKVKTVLKAINLATKDMEDPADLVEIHKMLKIAMNKKLAKFSQETNTKQ